MYLGLLIQWAFKCKTETSTEQCITKTESDKLVGPYLVRNWTNAESNIDYFMYREIGAGATWCQSYHFCKNGESQLAVITGKSEWKSITQNQSVTNPVWISARKKDFGASWTWVNDSLSGCIEECNNLSAGNL